MRKSRFTEAQIVGILKQSEAGTPTKDLCRQHGVSLTLPQHSFLSLADARRVIGGLAGGLQSPSAS